MKALRSDKTRWLSLPMEMSRALTPFEVRLVQKYSEAQAKLTVILSAVKRHNTNVDFFVECGHIVLRVGTKKVILPCQDFVAEMKYLEDIELFIVDRNFGKNKVKRRVHNVPL